MKVFRSALKDGGYDPEEVYFHHENQRLIQKMRENAAQESPKKNNVVSISRDTTAEMKAKYKKTG